MRLRRRTINININERVHYDLYWSYLYANFDILYTTKQSYKLNNNFKEGYTL